MAKDPAFLFYYQDFLVGTTFMTLEETGAYIKLLCFQAAKGPMTKDQILKKIPAPIWEAICGHYREANGFYYNERLQQEIDKRRLFTESRLKNLHMGSHMDAHMENENININKDKKDIKNRVVKGKEKMTDAEFIASIKQNIAYKGIDIDRELGRMDAWLSTPKGRGRQKTRAFIVNWLNKIDRPVQAPRPRQYAPIEQVIPEQQRFRGTGNKTYDDIVKSTAEQKGVK